jgi:hypothetical protein
MHPRKGAALAAAVLALGAVPARATTVRQMNLAEMCTRADKAFRGTVVHAQPREIEVRGGRLPVVTYRIRVEEAFKGRFTAAGGRRFVELTLLGDVKARRGLHVSVPGLPRLDVGQAYVLLTTRPGRLGLSTTVGLGQGAFRIERGARGETALNGVGNRDLLRGMARGADAPPPTAYQDLAARIRALVGAEAGR